MAIWIRTLSSCAILGTLAGAASAIARRSEAWPSLACPAALHAAALGWVVGLAIALVVALILIWRARGRPPRAACSSWRRVGGAVLGIAALAPGLLWLNLALPDSVASRTMQVGRPLRDTRPNIILITIDALRPDYLGAYGSSAGLTPNLDAFARDATRYDAAYASASWTLPSCGAMLTSRPPSECGLKATEAENTDWYTHQACLPDAVPFLPVALRRTGYTTAAELTNPFLSEPRGWKRGFDHYRNEDMPNPSALLTSRTARAVTVTDNARLWLRTNARAPFFFWVHYLDPHAPYDSPDTPPETRADYPADWETGRGYWSAHMQEKPRATKVAYADFRRALYAEEVRYADRWVGELLRELKRRGDYSRSLVVISADHGEEFFEHDGFDHGHSMHEEVLRVPLLVKWPDGWQADRVVADIVGLIDLAPTFLHAAEAEPMSGARGRLLPTRAGASEAEMYSEVVLHGTEQTALTTDRYKVIYRPFDASGEPTFAVYDRQHDRQEQHDLAGEPVANELRDRLQAYTEAAQGSAAKWRSVAGTEADRSQLDEQTKRKLETLGYLGN